MEFSYDFFISYNHKDEEYAKWIAWILEDASYKVFIQAWDFQPGNNIVLQMQKGATDARHTLALLSSNYMESLFTQPEWAAAFASDPTGASRTLIPILIEDIQTDGLLSQVSYINLLEKDADAAKRAILEGVQIERAKPVVAPSFPGIIKKKKKSDDVNHGNWYSSWLDKRIKELENNEENIFILPEGPKYSLHLIPIEALSNGKEYPVKDLSQQMNLKPLLTNAWDFKINKDGFSTFVRGQEKSRTYSYVQFYRNAIIEAVDTGLLSFGENDKLISIDKFEKEIIDHIKLHYLKAIRSIEVKLPIVVCICLYDIEDYTISSSRISHRLYNRDAINQSTLKLPIVHINSWEDNIEKLLKPSLDFLWNYCGFEGSLNYDQNGIWSEYKGY